MAINEALAKYLKHYHKGEANAVTSRELECSFQMRGSELRREINALRGGGIPIAALKAATTMRLPSRNWSAVSASSAAESRKSHLRSVACPVLCRTMLTPVSFLSRWMGVMSLEQLYPLGGRQEQAAVDHQQDGARSLQPFHRCLWRQRHGNHEPTYPTGLYGGLQRFQQQSHESLLLRENRPLALLAELGFLPLNTRDDFNVLYKFLSKGEITDDYLQEEMELTEILLKPPEAEAIRTLLLERAPRGDVRRAADFSSWFGTASAAALNHSVVSHATSAASST